MAERGTERRSHSPRIRAATFLLSLVVVGCGDAAAEFELDRSQRFGIFGDLVLYRRPLDEGGPFFLDRFETTRRDWHEYERGAAGAPPAAVEGSLPVTGIGLREARRFAHWRFGRLPRRDEWRYAATGGGSYVFPWGSRPERAWLNSAELGLNRATPVGTFESGRQPGGAYDLLGNVAEWTESVPDEWFAARPQRRRSIELPEVQLLVLQGAAGIQPWRLPGVPVAGAWLRKAGETIGGPLAPEAARIAAVPPLPRLARTPALTVWQPPPCPAPGAWLVAAWGDRLPRIVVGGHFRGLPFNMLWSQPDWRQPLLGREWLRHPDEHGSTTGLRVAADPVGLLEALLRQPQAPGRAEIAALRRFLGAAGHRSVLTAALPRALAAVAEPGPLARIVREALGR